MKTRCIFLFFFIISIGLIFTSCSKNIKETVLENQDASYRLIIAADSSDFKDSIRNKIINNYKDICYIEAVNLDKLERIDYDKYDAILIMDTCMAWGGFNGDVSRFIDKLNDNQKVVVLFTAGNPEWKYSYKGVDAISSASIITEEEVVVEKITQQVDMLLSQKNTE